MKKLLIPLVLLSIATVSLSVTTRIDTKNKLNLENNDFPKKNLYESETSIQYDSINMSVDLVKFDTKIELL